MSFMLFGFSVRFHPSFFVMAIILGMPRGMDVYEIARTVSWVAVVTFSILLHELGHAFANRAFGGGTSIELYSLGGVAIQDGDHRLSNGQRAIVSFAGPLAGFMLGGVVFAIQSSSILPDNNGLVTNTVRQLLWVNIGWGLLNLLPLLPLDGGNIMQAGLNALRDGKGIRPAQLISMFVGVTVAATAFYYEWLWAGLIAAWCVLTTYRQMKDGQAEMRDAPLWEDFAAADDLTEKDYVEGIQHLGDLLVKAKSNQLRAKITEQLAWHHVHQGNIEDAVRALSGMPESWKASSPLLGHIYYRQGRYDEATPLLEQSAKEFSDSESWWPWIAISLCETYIKVGQPDLAVEFLNGAIERIQARNILSAIDASLFHAGHFKRAAELGETSFVRFGDPNDAYNVACCLAKIPNAEERALSWLSKAVDAGYSDGDHLDADADLDAIRALPGYEDLRAKICRVQT